MTDIIAAVINVAVFVAVVGGLCWLVVAGFRRLGRSSKH